ncbi:PREDICTED: putative UDP-GlcNAc:betaGal beta-1,3-N-acetylglucosaminyltransferase LOC100288842 [Chinchilla lanigera]|uniref:putative UDP-GlcNAc:betaGal beta-1,3-N-acetylglucosaminyltransferase LOC100288842 n=1 Tax=Chinchilla lanigera TaxID=34839 RepID=UPI00038EF4D5|nr:PREDICTED: putative UDP-GlcNAc:betaGal beta-1,3-N-acetylglucosaminyltransferase LOC100288842 [Chinchilla lanigera]
MAPATKERQTARGTAGQHKHARPTGPLPGGHRLTHRPGPAAAAPGPQPHRGAASGADYVISARPTARRLRAEAAAFPAPAPRGRWEGKGQVKFCRLRTHQWCFILFNVILFHALLFGAEFVEEYFLHSLPPVDMKHLEIKDKARTLNMEPVRSNPFKYYVLSQPEVCKEKNIFLLSLVFSSPENRTRRDLIRKTWGNVTSVQGHPILTLFALGMPLLVTTQKEIDKESHKNNDIIEGIFLDSSENQTLKVIAMTQWAVTFCPNALFILKVNEEMFVNLPALVNYLLNLKEHLEDIYVGRVIHQDTPNRDPSTLEFVSLSEYPETYYPDYCSGEGFIMSQDVARMMYVVFKEVSIMVPADVFVGICAKTIGIKPMHSSRFSGKRHIRYNRCCYKFIFTSSEIVDAEMPLAWKEINDGKDCSLFETYYGLISCKLLTYLDSFKRFHMGTIKNNAMYFGD